MNYNAVLSVRDVTDSSGPITEPVTLVAMKNYLRLMGFVDVDQSPSTDLADFDFDDELLSDMITAARELIEEKSGLSIVTHTWEAWLVNLSGRIELPYGPVISITSVTDANGSALTYATVGNLWKYLKSPLQKDIKVTYTAGYGDVLTADLPRAIKIDIMRLVTYMYTHRGDDPKIEDFCSQMASKYARNGGII